MDYYKQDEIESVFFDWLKENDNHLEGMEPSDIHHEVFNLDYFIIGRHKATQWLGDRVFEVIGIIKDYEQDNFGEVTTDLTEPEKVVNMYAYIVGEQIIYNHFA